MMKIAKMQPILDISQSTKSTKSYDKNKACDRISFDLYSGQNLGIIGESGSGNSTLLNNVGGNLLIDRIIA